MLQVSSISDDGLSALRSLKEKGAGMFFQRERDMEIEQSLGAIFINQNTI